MWSPGSWLLALSRQTRRPQTSLETRQDRLDGFWTTDAAGVDLPSHPSHSLVYNVDFPQISWRLLLMINLELRDCGNLHAEDESCRHGNTVLPGFLFGEMIPDHIADPNHNKWTCGWCELYGRDQALTQDSRRCDKCQDGAHGFCRGNSCGCACA